MANRRIEFAMTFFYARSALGSSPLMRNASFFRVETAQIFLGSPKRDRYHTRIGGLFTSEVLLFPR